MMIMIQFIVGLIIGACVSLFLYACILMGKIEDEYNYDGDKHE